MPPSDRGGGDPLPPSANLDEIGGRSRGRGFQQVGPYENEIRAIEDMYKSIWQFHAFVDSAWADKQPVVALAFEQELDFRNGRLLAQELEHEPESLFSILATDLKGDIAANELGPIITEVDTRVQALRFRNERRPADKREWLRTLIKSVNAPAPAKQTRLPLKELGGKSE